MRDSYLTGAILLSILTGIAACGDDGGSSRDSVECRSDDDCEEQFHICNENNKCQPRDNLCYADDDCEGEHKVCDETARTCVFTDDYCEKTEDCEGIKVCRDHKCVRKTTGQGEACDSDSDCREELICSDDDVCVLPEQPQGCTRTEDCPGNQVCRQNSCVTPSVQCSEIGDSCDPDADKAIGDGFTCLDRGEGPECFDVCNPDDSTCPTGTTCRQLDNAEAAVCVSSGCDGWRDSKSCEGIVRRNPDRFQNGAKCVPSENDPDEFTCKPAGSKGEGDSCSPEGDEPECGSGMICTEGTCSNVCTQNSECPDNQRCLGEESSELIGESVGVCREGVCSPFQHGQSDCPESEGCLPVTSNDGVCRQGGENNPFEECQFQRCATDAECPSGVACSVPPGEAEGVCDFGPQCSDGARCFPLATGEARCLPPCDPTADEPTNTCPTPNANQCIDVVRDNEGVTPRDGACVQTCEPVDYGSSRCQVDKDVCTPFSSQLGEQRQWHHGCFPSANISEGEACQPAAPRVQCEEGAFCDPRGDGSGVCESYCATGGTDNAALQCGSGQTCGSELAEGLGLARCEYSCSPDSFPENARDDSCPEHAATCLPRELDQNGGATEAYCAASGTKSEGADCGDVSSGDGVSEVVQQNCRAGLRCVVDNALNPTAASDAQAPTCQSLCDPFKPAGQTSNCPEGEACGQIRPLQSAAGTCFPKDTEATNEFDSPCRDAGLMCGDGSVCIDFSFLYDNVQSGAFRCLKLCEYASGHGCGEGERCIKFGGNFLFDDQFGHCTAPPN